MKATYLLKFENIQNTSEFAIKMVVAVITDPFTLWGVFSLLFTAFVLHTGRIGYEVFLTRPMTKLFRHIRKKFLTKKTETQENERNGLERTPNE